MFHTKIDATQVPMTKPVDGTLKRSGEIVICDFVGQAVTHVKLENMTSTKLTIPGGFKRPSSAIFSRCGYFFAVKDISKVFILQFYHELFFLGLVLCNFPVTSRSWILAFSILLIMFALHFIQSNFVNIQILRVFN